MLFKTMRQRIFVVKTAAIRIIIGACCFALFHVVESRNLTFHNLDGC